MTYTGEDEADSSPGSGHIYYALQATLFILTHQDTTEYVSLTELL